MNQTIDDMIQEWLGIEQRHSENPKQCLSLERFLVQSESDIFLINNNCIGHNCTKYKPVEFRGKTIHCCFDDWSFVKVGWHNIYCETLDLCFEHHLNEGD